MKATAKYSVAMLAAMGLVGLASPAMAGDQGWAAGSTGSPASVSELIPRMSSGQAYSERYSFSVDLDGGGHVGMNFTISNLGVRNGYGASEVRVNLPNESRVEESDRVRRSHWSYDEDNFGLDIAGATIKADGDDAFDLTYDGDDIQVELRFENTMQMWRPGNGEIRSDDEYYRFMLVSPRANVSGRVHVGGKWHDVKGTHSGYGDHVATNVAPYNMAKRFTRFRSYEGSVFVMWREVHLTRDFGGGTVTWAVVGVDDKIVYEDTSASVRFGNMERDDDTGYQVPHAIQLTSNSGDNEMRFLLRGDDVEKRDLLASYGRAARAVASRVSNPFQYNVRGEYALELTVDGRRLRTTSTGHVTVDYVNH